MRTARLDLPPSPSAQINATAQYASHVVNLLVPHFGNGQVDGPGFELQDVTSRFHEYFPDEYDSIVIVPAEATLIQLAAWHLWVRNQISDWLQLCTPTRRGKAAEVGYGHWRCTSPSQPAIADS